MRGFEGKKKDGPGRLLARSTKVRAQPLLELATAASSGRFYPQLGPRKFPRSSIDRPSGCVRQKGVSKRTATFDLANSEPVDTARLGPRSSRASTTMAEERARPLRYGLRGLRS
jgi:hypothetical protein